MQSSETESKFLSRKFMMVATTQLLATAMLLTKNIESGDWVESTKWSLSAYMAANAIGETKINIPPLCKGE